MKFQLKASVIASVMLIGLEARADNQILGASETFGTSQAPTDAVSAEPERVERLSGPATEVEARASSAPSRDDHPTPKLKLSYVRFSTGGPTGGSVPLEALRLDMYALSWRWFRVGVDAEAGRGQASFLGVATSLKYGLLGISAGLQFPGRVTPFLEGRLAGGVLAGTAEGTLTIPGTTIGVTGASAATWMYAGELDAGVEFYVLGRSYLSTSLGLIRSTWRSADEAPSGGIAFKDLSQSSLLLKIGLGI
jgi:hypothetical protein